MPNPTPPTDRLRLDLLLLDPTLANAEVIAEQPESQRDLARRLLAGKRVKGAA